MLMGRILGIRIRLGQGDREGLVDQAIILMDQVDRGDPENQDILLMALAGQVVEEDTLNLKMSANHLLKDTLLTTYPHLGRNIPTGRSEDRQARKSGVPHGKLSLSQALQAPPNPP